MARGFGRWGAWLLVLMALAGCSLQPIAADGSLMGLVTPYRIDIVQGNVITREMAAQVRPGMTRAQVRDLLGTPMLTDPFHADRWDYFFSFRRTGVPLQQRSVVAHFDGEALARLDVPEALPSEVEFVSTLDTSKRRGPPPTLELTAEQKAALPVPTRRETPGATAPAAPPRTFPPLER